MMPLQHVDFSQSVKDQERCIGIYDGLMPRRVSNILLISSLYDYCIMEEDGRLAERIIHEYRGLNLTRPPIITWVSSADEALAVLAQQSFQLIITMPRISDGDFAALIRTIKHRWPEIYIHELSHQVPRPQVDYDAIHQPPGIDRAFVWSGNTDLLVAQIKSVEDQWNVVHDTAAAGVRVILLVEDSAYFLSSLLPILYREVVTQTQAAMEEGLNEEHRILTMRSRAKIMVAQTYEQALDIFNRFASFFLGVISDVRFPRGGQLDSSAGVDLSRLIKNKIADLPILLTSSDPKNKAKADAAGAAFADKNSPLLHRHIRSFLLDHLGFGDFVFRLPDGREVARASNRLALERVLSRIPIESYNYHANRNDFSRWLFARGEILLAQRLRPETAADYKGDMGKMRSSLQRSLAYQRKWRQKGVVVDFNADDVDVDTELLKIGRGSMGGKARGLVFFARLLKQNHRLYEKYARINTIIPQTLVVTTDVYDALVSTVDLEKYAREEASNKKIAELFLQAPFPDSVISQLKVFLAHVDYPLAVRSSGLLEDARFQAYAGLYRTYMLPNDHSDINQRLSQLLVAIRLVYASTYFSDPKAFARRIGHRVEEEKMAVIVQKLIGNPHGDFFYPTLSGVAQSLNYYPYGGMAPEDGCATITLGLGKTVVEGEAALRFNPRQPQVLPHFSTTKDILANAQRYFYALRLGGGLAPNAGIEDPNLVRRRVPEACDEPPVQFAGATYYPDEDRIRDTGLGPGQRVITFPRILKHQEWPLPEMLSDILSLTQEGMGAPVELEFAFDPITENHPKPSLAVLQVRPMAAGAPAGGVSITDGDIQAARLMAISTRALGHGMRKDIRDIVYVKPEAFDPAQTTRIATAIGRV